ncbi:MAG: protease HtpX [Succinivibrionaceae bacterium]|nr:protease HtpX [Succinivibrionaceae bacterium]
MVLYGAMTAGILVLVGIMGTLLCALSGIQIDAMGYASLLGFCAIMGFAGSLISLFLSKPLCKRTYRVQVIDRPTNEAQRLLVDTVAEFARQYGFKMPEVGIYHSSDPNAFATGATRDGALVAVSTGLLDCMDRDAVRGVIGHEMTHIENGDMVTMSLLQGVLNTFVYFISFVASQALAGRGRGGSSAATGALLRMVCQAVFGFLSTLLLMWFSRWREYRADAGSARLNGAQPMIKALEALQRSAREASRPQGRAFSAMAINASPLGSLLASHPPLEERIAALRRSGL